MTVEKKPFVGKECDHEDAVMDISFNADEFEIIYACVPCGGHNIYHLEKNYKYDNFSLTWHDEKEVCVECDRREEDCHCEQCIDCGSLEDDHYDGKCLMCEEVTDVRLEGEKSG